ncbi:MAG TPA: DUF2242 domain-containing protein [Denitromonas sp.]|uniref:DUF2242 domain-containing protein n=1 Tax=Denitromonas sp. TaxID=2734609 RepID=UPI001DD80B64|nr:DUF2242 domain-containing protein [Rhodocyclaceae bacterium]MCP5222496.1 DUF2242 domain-containing protein [Zoogloeaceae bacterium]HPR05203.1 DUF2242 domain-containing protein [Denitromonas sp.]HQU90332.1 DUF2242 domain-containing protein [Denitromonas sp.]HQV16445.1 DUF2242 domain-containing protein [Denitromonas sp.]
MNTPSICLMAASLAGLSACGGPSVYDDERFSSNSPYVAHFDTTSGATCEAARLALLSQGYAIHSAKADAIDAMKTFQPDDDEHLELSFTVVCASGGRGRSTAYANAVETYYELKESASSAGLSVSRLGSISLPWSSSTDSLIKVGAQTVSDPEFYARFFTLMARHAPRTPPPRP